MALRRTLAVASMLVLFSPGLARAEEPPSSSAEPDASSVSSVGSELPPEIRALLVEEMNAVLAATQRILDALVRGRDSVVAENAQAIHDSFILEQKMTAEDRRTLREALPEAFIERDQAFHEISSELAAAAREGETAEQLRLFDEMTDACVECHSRHATDRFPDLRPSPSGQRP